jgi:hypothetical protein
MFLVSSVPRNPNPDPPIKETISQKSVLGIHFLKKKNCLTHYKQGIV